MELREVNHERHCRALFTSDMTALPKVSTKVKSALDNNVPIYICVDSQVHAEYQTFLKNRNNADIVFAYVDSINIFLLLEEILLQRRNNALTTFARYSEIEDWLRDQWAGIFRDMLKRITQSQQLSSLSIQISELSEINRTLRTYLDTFMQSVSPDETKGLIQSESQRLNEIQRETQVLQNNFIFLLLIATFQEKNPSI